MGALDPAAIAEVSEQSWPVVRDADELHDALLTLVVLPPVEEWRGYYDELARAGRASTIGGHWVATERLDRKDDTLAILRGMGGFHWSVHGRGSGGATEFAG